MKKLTNPFDDSSVHGSDHDENFYDCEQHQEYHQIEESEEIGREDKSKTNNGRSTATAKQRFENNPFEDVGNPFDQQQQRTAKLNFDARSAFDDIDTPGVLDFDIKETGSSEFFSPLENAMIQQNMPNSPTTRRQHGFSLTSFSQDDDCDDNDSQGKHDESSPLLRREMIAAAATAREGLRTPGTPQRNREMMAAATLGGTSSSGILTPQRSTGSLSELSSMPSTTPSTPQKQQRPSSIPNEISTSDDHMSTPNRKKKGKRRALQKRSSLTKSARSNSSSKKSKVLTTLVGGENEFSVEYKYILLEDLGTASSWLILLLPYFAFAVSVLLASTKSIQVASVGPLAADMPCGSVDIPFVEPCYHVASQQNQTSASSRYYGFVFESGTLESIPVISTSLYGDATYQNLSEDAVSFVNKGSLEASVVVFQQQNAYDDTSVPSWTVMYSSPKPERVTMICSKTSKDSSTSSWNCKTPRIIDILFSMPETAVYAGGNIRVNVNFALRRDEDENLSDQSDGNEYGSNIEEIVSSSSYTLEQMSHFAQALDTSVRLLTFFASFAFMIYWCNSMGVWKQLCCYCRCCSRRNKEEPTTLWWESPWILFPERYYILVLLLSLLLMQEPVLATMFFFPQLGSSTRLHLAADATIGIGVHGVLFVYLCLFHGFRFHTAEVARKRTEHQRKSIELRKAAKYVSEAQKQTDDRGAGPLSTTEAKISQYTNDYYEQFGDVDGSASTGHLRLQNDPFGDGWADFLLYKILLFLIGAAAVIGTAYCRFPPDDENVSQLEYDMLERYRTGYVVSIISQFVVELIWMYLILEAAVVTGRILRNEPFLSTRPSQLAYRILFAQMSLGFLALGASIFLSLSQLLTKWSLQAPDDASFASVITGNDDYSGLEMLLHLLSQVAQQFPYSGTAASVGSGRIIFATISILVTAFIFLPAHILEDEGEDDRSSNMLKEQKRLRRDKRLVVHLARESKTWRVFPIPIEPSAVETTMLQDRGYQLYKNMHIEYDNTRERGVVSVGPYTPVFCVELACWLNEASWQAYYSPAGLLEESVASIKGMNLESIGLHLEGAVYDAATDSQAYVATNIGQQVDGDEDSIIVIAFRGTASKSNVQTDLRHRQVPLLDQITGIGSAPFCIFPDRLEISDADGWVWDTPVGDEDVKCAISWTSSIQGCMPSHCARAPEPRFAAVSKGARAILQATPVARSTFPQVHQGFQEVYSKLRRKLLDILFPVIQRQLAKSLRKSQENGTQPEPLVLPKVYCTGHSLGGSLAQLLALDLASNCEIVLPVVSDSAAAGPVPTINISEDEIFKLPSPISYQKSDQGVFPHTTTSSQQAKSAHLHHQTKTTAVSHEIRLQPPIAVYTFGQPRVGNKAFTRLYKQKVPHTFRVVNEGDVITTMPNIVCCGGIYKHSGLAVLLDEGCTGNILVGPTIVETVFRFHQVTTNVLAHSMDRYRDCLESAFAQDELVEYFQGHNCVKGKDGVGRPYDNREVDIPQWMTNFRSH